MSTKINKIFMVAAMASAAAVVATGCNHAQSAASGPTQVASVMGSAPTANGIALSQAARAAQAQSFANIAQDEAQGAALARQRHQNAAQNQ